MPWWLLFAPQIEAPSKEKSVVAKFEALPSAFKGQNVVSATVALATIVTTILSNERAPIL
jgi:hypothetical protein